MGSCGARSAGLELPSKESVSGPLGRRSISGCATAFAVGKGVALSLSVRTTGGKTLERETWLGGASSSLGAYEEPDISLRDGELIDDSED